MRNSELDVVLNFEVISCTSRTDNNIMRPVAVFEPIVRLPSRPHPWT
jgi:hypothetical protein